MDLLVPKFRRLLVGDEFRICGIDLCPVTKRHDDEILVIPLTIRVHFCISLPLANRAGALHQIGEDDATQRAEDVFRHVSWAYPTVPSPYYAIAAI